MTQRPLFLIECYALEEHIILSMIIIDGLHYSVHDDDDDDVLIEYITY
jgi:hypothetical protein